MSNNAKSRKKDNHRPDAQMRRRMLIICVVLVIFIAYILITLFKISIIDNAKYEVLANENQFRSNVIKANRGSIYDSTCKILAQSATVYTIAVAPTKLADIEDAAEQTRQKQAVAKILSDNIPEVDYDTFLQKLETAVTETPDSQWLKVADKIEKPVADEILSEMNEQELASKVIFTNEDTKRYYPQSELAASVIGFTNYDGDGVYGVEAYYNDYLAGVDGKNITATDANGDEMPYKNDKNYSAKDGSSVYLTLDMTLQYYLEKNLDAAIEDYGVENRACGIMMNAKTGAILAMATSPGFDLNDRNSIYYYKDRNTLAEIEDEDLYDETYAALREKQWKNKAISETYYPGSVFKVITGSAALEEKAVDLNTIFSCNHTYTVIDTDFHCWSAGSHGPLDFQRAMTVSCNPFFIQVGQALGGTKFCEYFKAFGFTEKTGIDLPGEADSIYVRAENMGPVELASSSFGQTNKVTPIQMITAYAAVINGGYLVQPHVVEKIVDSNGNVVKTEETKVIRQVISEETSAEMRTVLENVVSGNGGGNAYIKGYRIGGKSGTAQKQDENNARGREDLYASSYCGFFPADDPEIILLVMVDEPLGLDANGSHIYYGSVTACPVVTNVFKEALPYLGYYPEYSEEELAAMDVTVPSVEGQSVEKAEETLTELGLSSVVIGSGSSVVSQMPARGSSVPHEGRVILYTDEDYETEYTTVPNVLGYSVSDVNLLLAQADLNFKIGDGGAANHTGAVASSQSYYYGDVVPKGTVVEVYFTVKDEG